MSSRIEIGPYVEGEIPEPLEYQFFDDAGAVVDLTGYTATFRLQIGELPGESHAAGVSSPAEGKVTYTWVAGDLIEGTLAAEFWVTNGTNTFPSKRFSGIVAAAIEVEA